MTDALLSPKLSPEAMAIIKEGTPKPQTPLLPTVVHAQKPASQVGGEVSDSKPTIKSTVMLKPRSQKDKPDETPNMVPFSIRLPASLPLALLKATSDRKLKRLQPNTNQAIVAEALNDWLEKHGYEK